MEQSEGTKDAMLPLDEPRVISIADGKFVYRFFFGRIVQEDWSRYFAGIYAATSAEEKAQVQTIDMDTAGIDLFERKLVKVEGYASTFDITKQGWQAKIPPRHATRVAWLLRDVSSSTDEMDSPFDPERIEVRLDALWSQSHPDGKVTKYNGLVHWFMPPSMEDKRRYYRALSAAKVVGGSGRRGTTIHPSRHGAMLELYDKLIHSVDGYSVGGKPLGADRDVIRREMDGYHKAIAALQLFVGGVPEPEANTEAA